MNIFFIGYHGEQCFMETICVVFITPPQLVARLCNGADVTVDDLHTGLQFPIGKQLVGSYVERPEPNGLVPLQVGIES